MIRYIFHKTLNNFLQSKNNFLRTEYDIFPFVGENIQKILFIVEDKLAINYTCSKKIISTLCKQLSDVRKNNILQNHSTDSDDQQISITTCAILLFIPDHRTAWNIRKELILLSHLSIEEEFKLTKLILTKHPKSYETFAQRSWLLKILEPPSSLYSQSICEARLYMNKKNLKYDFCASTEGFLKLLENELHLCNDAGGKYLCNYALWDHRRLVLHKTISLIETLDKIVELLKNELSLSDSFISTHISDSSSYSYRQFLTTKHLDYSFLKNKDYSDIKIFIDGELISSKDFIEFYPNHESLWLYRKFLLKKMAKLIKERSIQLSINNFIIDEKNKWTQKSTNDIWSQKHLLWIEEFLVKYLH